jgi:CrcB protein
MHWILIGIGGALGSMIRFFLQGRIQAACFRAAGAAGAVYVGFPVGTLAVNLIGSGVIGFLAGLFESAPVSANLKLFLMVGILGGFTTFSSFSLENINLIRAGQGRAAILYILLSNVLGIGLAFAGYFLARLLARSMGLGSPAG